MKKTVGGILNSVYNAYAIRATLVASLSAISAFLVANIAPDFISPTIASIIALTAIKTSVNDTVKETFKQIGGSFFGALLGIFLISYIGFNAYSILIIVGASMAIGFLIRLQVQGGLAIAGTVILVSGPLFGDFQSIEQRVAGVLVGAVFAFIASLFMSPWQTDKKILKSILEVGYNSTRLLTMISKAYKKNKIKSEDVKVWIREINFIYDKANSNSIEAKQLFEDARWSPFVPADSAENIKQQARLVKINVAAIRTIILAIDSSISHRVFVSDETSRRIYNLMRVLASSFEAQLIAAASKPAAKLGENYANEIRDRRRKLANEISKMDDTRAIMLGGTILHEATKIKDLISGEAGND